MQRIADEMKKKALGLLEDGSVGAVIAWEKGELPYSSQPAFFQISDALGGMIYDSFCGGNLSKYLIEKSKEDKKVLVFLKPCDTYSLNQLLAENQVVKGKIHAVGIGCSGHVDIEKIRAKGFLGILDIDEDGENLNIKTLYGDKSCPRSEVLLDKCLSCKGKEHRVFDELIGADLSQETSEESVEHEKFAQIENIESKTSDERFAFWRAALPKCIRCNACRNICPSCTCQKCIFDNAESGVGAKVNVTDFEENLFHIIRAFHVAGRCSDCGECGRVCPQNIPLHLLNRKHVKDINSFFGKFQAGETDSQTSPLLNYEFDDAEPNVVSKREGK